MPTNRREPFQIKESYREQDEFTNEVIVALSNAVEAKDRYTNGHSQRVAIYSCKLAKRLGWDEESCRHAYYTGLLHDVGKIRVPDSIINKTGQMTKKEYEEMKLHTLAGYYLLKGISSISDFAVGARWHHERYDGKGYPNGLSGTNIPLISRIVCVADSYDAMTSSRSYRSLLPQGEVRKEIERGMGTQFDPNIGGIMLQMINEDVEYRMRQPDPMTEYTILAVDDDSMVLRFLEFVLEKEGRYHIIPAHSGREGVDISRDEKIDLVLLDVEMPDIDGFEALRRIRERDQHLPVVFMTGEKDMDIIQKAESMGVSDYLTKPLDQRVLRESLQNVLRSNIRRTSFAGA